jgi:hypothetical protein
VSNNYVGNAIYYNSPYYYGDGIITPTGDLVIIGNTSKQYPNGSYGLGDPFIAKIANVGIPYTNPWIGNMEDVTSYYDQPFILYPNPTVGLTSVKTGRDGTLTVYTVLGQVVWTGTVHHFQESIDFTSLASGLYLYDFYGENASHKIMGKFIKE